MKMPVSEALAIAIIGFCTVLLILAVIAVLIILLSKAVRTIENMIAKKSSASSAESPVPAPVQPAPEGVNCGEVDLIGIDEKTAAVIMAIVSQQSGIPLNRLSFKSIRLLDDKKKGDSTK